MPARHVLSRGKGLVGAESPTRSLLQAKCHSSFSKAELEFSLSPWKMIPFVPELVGPEQRRVQDCAGLIGVCWS